MQGYMFRSRLGALIFMGFILLAVFRVIGTEDNSGDLALASEQIEAQSQSQPQSHPAGSYDQQPATASDWEAKQLQDDGWGQDAFAPAN